MRTLSCDIRDERRAVEVIPRLILHTISNAATTYFGARRMSLYAFAVSIADLKPLDVSAAAGVGGDVAAAADATGAGGATATAKCADDDEVYIWSVPCNNW